MVLAETSEKTEGRIEVKASVLLCAWRNMVIETAECMVMLRDAGWGYSISRGDALISRARSRTVTNWYQNTSDDVFLMIDDDVVFEPWGAQRVVDLAREKRSIAIGAYPVKDGGHLACRRYPGQEITFGPAAPPVEIQWPATGFMAVHRDVIDAMIEARNPDGSALFPYCDVGGSGMWPFFDCFALEHPDGRFEYLSEDYAFGERARQLGFRTWLATDVNLFHMGMYPYCVQNMKNVRVTEVPEEQAPVTTTDGFRMFLPEGDEVIALDLRNQGAWDIPTRDAIVENLRPGETFLDLGAHIGYFSLLAASMGNPVIAIEALPANADLLRRNVSLNGYPNVRVIEAVAGIGGDVGMVTEGRNSGSAYTRPGGSVRSRLLSDLLGKVRPNFLKVDVEGDEYKVLATSPDVLHHARAILVEVSEEQLQRQSGVSADALLSLLRGHGFELRKVTHRNGYDDWLGVKEDA